MKKGILLLSAMLLMSCSSVPGSESLDSVASSSEEIIEYPDDDFSEEPFDVSQFQEEQPLSSSLVKKTEHKGTVEKLDYTCHSYALESLEENKGKELMVNKSLYVYLPYGYDETISYDILYLYHGTGDFEDYWLIDRWRTPSMIDYMMDEGLSNDCIIVTPTYYSIPEDYPGYESLSPIFLFNEDPNASLWPDSAYQELTNDIIPLVESKYHTHSEFDTSMNSLIGSRHHRGIAGLSRGAYLTTQAGVVQGLKIFSYFGCFSGAGEDVDMVRSAMDSYHGVYDIRYWYFATGTEDIVQDKNMYESVTAFYEEIKRHPLMTEDVNTHLVIHPDGSHSYDSWQVDLYNILQVFFRY